jgi:hypothetical protein
MACCVPSGSEAYAALYPETSSDNVLRLGNVVPDFEAETTVGPPGGPQHTLKGSSLNLQDRGSVHTAATAFWPEAFLLLSTLLAYIPASIVFNTQASWVTQPSTELQ